MSLYSALLILHIAAGSLSLSAFFVPMIAKKGGRWHRVAGRWFVYGMWTVIITALLLSIIIYRRKQVETALFFVFLALLTAGPLYYGIAILKHKKGGVPRRLVVINLTLTVLTQIFALYLLITDSPLLIAFGIIGTIASMSKLTSHRKKIENPQHWIMEHISGMLITSIAAFTAFFSFGGRTVIGELLPGNWQLIPWILPTVLGVIAIRYYKARYRVA